MNPGLVSLPHFDEASGYIFPPACFQLAFDLQRSGEEVAFGRAVCTNPDLIKAKFGKD